MNAAILTSVSAQTPWATLTTPNHADYCQRHGYTHIARHKPYHEAVADFDFLETVLDHFQAVWCLDSDAVITNHTLSLATLPLRDGMNVCEEGLHPACPINCGSVIWTRHLHSRRVLSWLRTAEPEWRKLTWISQQWIAEQLQTGGWWNTVVTVHPPRTFNSCHHGPKCLWQPGDFVYHPCGMPHAERMARIREHLEAVVK